MTPSRKAISLCEKLQMDRSPVIWQLRKSNVIAESKADTSIPDGFGRYDVVAFPEH